MIFKKIATKKNPIKFSSPLTILSESFPLLRERSPRGSDASPGQGPGEGGT